MSITVRARHEYDQPLAKVWAVFTDPEFYQAKFEGIGHRAVEVVSAEREGDEFSIEISREVPVDVPAVLRGLLGDWNTLLQTEHWAPAGKNAYSNELSIEARGVPATMRGRMQLSANGMGCVNEVEITIRASVPLIGGKLEQFAARDAEATLAAEYDFIQGYLESA
jgi:carbon monoxide dehydrogenase subunit G